MFRMRRIRIAGAFGITMYIVDCRSWIAGISLGRFPQTTQSGSRPNHGEGLRAALLNDSHLAKPPIWIGF